MSSGGKTAEGRGGLGDELLCPVCRRGRFEEKGGWEICEVCGWEDDPVQRRDPDLTGGANHLSLHQARLAYLAANEAPWNWV